MQRPNRLLRFPGTAQLLAYIILVIASLCIAAFSAAYAFTASITVMLALVVAHGGLAGEFQHPARSRSAVGGLRRAGPAAASESKLETDGRPHVAIEIRLG